MPRSLLEAAGFSFTGRSAHSESWMGPGGIPVRFTAHPALAVAVQRAVRVSVQDVCVRVISRIDLLHEKLRAVSDPAQRRSQRMQDLADAQALLEETPELGDELDATEQELLDRWPA